jgi:hypothetical protein
MSKPAKSQWDFDELFTPKETRKFFSVAVKSLLKVFSLVACCYLVSCSKLPHYRFTGNHEIVLKDHWIDLQPVCLARTDGDKWYIASGPPGDPVECLEFTAGFPSNGPSGNLEIVRIEALRSQGASLIFDRLSKEKEFKQEFETTPRELWVLAQPSPTNCAPQLPEGDYQIKIHYRFERQEYDAEWKCSYKIGSQKVRWWDYKG